MARLGHARHHPVRADRDDAVCLFGADRDFAQAAGRVGFHRLHDVAHEGAVLRAAWRKPRGLVAAPHDDVGGGFDLVDLVTVDDLLVPGEVQHARAARPERLPDRKQHRIAQATSGQQHRFAAFDVGRRAGRSHQDHRLARGERRDQVGRASHLQHDARHQPLVRVDPGAGHREALGMQPGPRDQPGQRLEVLQPVELARAELAGRRRRLDHDLDDRRRQPLHRVDGGEQLGRQSGEEILAAFRGGRCALMQ